MLSKGTLSKESMAKSTANITTKTDDNCIFYNFFQNKKIKIICLMFSLFWTLIKIIFYIIW
jgi:hypothetical protein